MFKGQMNSGHHKKSWSQVHLLEIKNYVEIKSPKIRKPWGSFGYNLRLL